MGVNHLRVLQSMPEVSAIDCFDLSGINLQNLWKVNTHKRLGDLIASNPDYVVVAVPTSQHFGISMELANARIPTLIEKPLALNSIEANEIYSAFEGNKTQAGVGFIERFNPALNLMREKIQEGIIGKPLKISTKRIGPYPGRIQDVGVISDLASHDIDFTSWIFETNYLKISSQKLFVRGGDKEDLVLMSGILGNDMLFSHSVNWLSPVKIRETTVLGENGMLVADSLKAELRYFENGSKGSDWDMFSNFRGVAEGQEVKFIVNVREPLVLEHESFIRKIKGMQESEICGLQHAVFVSRVVEQVQSE